MKWCNFFFTLRYHYDVFIKKLCKTVVIEIHVKFVSNCIIKTFLIINNIIIFKSRHESQYTSQYFRKTNYKNLKTHFLLYLQDNKTEYIKKFRFRLRKQV